jgi:hypothetical protein
VSAQTALPLALRSIRWSYRACPNRFSAVPVAEAAGMDDPLVTFVTTTAYGSWLPGDTRGYVQRGEMLPANPNFEKHAKALLQRPPDPFSHRDRAILVTEFVAACKEFAYRPLDLSIEAWHLHWIVQHKDPVESMVGRLNNRMRQRLDRGRIWTVGYCHHVLRRDEELVTARKYIREHPGCRISDGRINETGADTQRTEPSDSKPH